MSTYLAVCLGGLGLVVGCAAPPEPTPPAKPSCSMIATAPWYSVTGDGVEVEGENPTPDDRAACNVKGDVLTLSLQHGDQKLGFTLPTALVDQPTPLDQVSVTAPEPCTQPKGLVSFSSGLPDWRVWITLECSDSFKIVLIAATHLAADDG